MAIYQRTARPSFPYPQQTVKLNISILFVRVYA